MRRNLKTKYGWVTLNVEELGSPRILAILPRQQPAHNNEQKDFRKKLPDGAVLISRHEEGESEDRRFYQIYKQGVYPALRSRQIIKRVLVRVDAARDVKAGLGIGQHDVHMRGDAAACSAIGIDANCNISGSGNIDVGAYISVAIKRPSARSAAGGFL